jgi:hypothetical protein
MHTKTHLGDKLIQKNIFHKYNRSQKEHMYKCIVFTVTHCRILNMLITVEIMQQKNPSPHKKCNLIIHKMVKYTNDIIN